MIKAVIFDLDGTLFDYTRSHNAALVNLTLEGGRLLNISQAEFSIAYEWGREKVKNNIPIQAASHNRLLYIENALEHLGFKPALFALNLYDVYWNTFLDNMSLLEEADELLEYLRRKGIKICLCSDLTAHIQYRKLRKLSIETCFDYIVTSEEAGIEKPNKRIFHLALDKLNVKAEEAVFIGDNKDRDIKGAEEVGMKAFLYGTVIYPKETNPNYQIYKFIEG